jgi:aquaporin Z
MSTVLYFSNHHRLGRYTGLFAGLVIATYVTLEAPFSGMSMSELLSAMSIDTMRKFVSSPLPAIWSGLLVYLSAPPLGMLAAGEIYLWWKGSRSVKCCKLHHDSGKRCIFCGANGGFTT